MKDFYFKVFIANVGEYASGNLIGEWMSLPISREEAEKVFDRVRNGAEDFEYIITEYDTSVKGLSANLGEHENISCLNYLAGELSNLDEQGMTIYESIVSAEVMPGINIEDYINLTANLDAYSLLEGVRNEDELGRATIDRDKISSLGNLAMYFDYEAYGRDFSINTSGNFVEAGYIYLSSFYNEVFSGKLEEIPKEYRLIGEEKMTVIIIEPGKEPYLKDIGMELEDLQAEVDGYIQALYPFDDEIAVICNEEGKLRGMKLNRALTDEKGNVYDVLVGTVVITGLTSSDFGSLSPELQEKYMEHFKYPETFMKIDGQIVAAKVKNADSTSSERKDRTCEIEL